MIVHVEPVALRRIGRVRHDPDLDDPQPAAVIGESFNSADQPLMATWPNVNRVNRMGSFKAAPLRNVEKTGPYFHNGSVASLRDVVTFYARGGNFRDENIRDLDPDIQPIGFTTSEKQALVAFLIALTDPRVAAELLPGTFDAEACGALHASSAPTP